MIQPPSESLNLLACKLWHHGTRWYLGASSFDLCEPLRKCRIYGEMLQNSWTLEDMGMIRMVTQNQGFPRFFPTKMVDFKLETDEFWSLLVWVDCEKRNGCQLNVDFSVYPNVDMSTPTYKARFSSTSSS